MTISDRTVATDPLFKTSCDFKILLKRKVRVNIGMNIGTVKSRIYIHAL